MAPPEPLQVSPTNSPPLSSSIAIASSFLSPSLRNYFRSLFRVVSSLLGNKTSLEHLAFDCCHFPIHIRLESTLLGSQTLSLCSTEVETSWECASRVGDGDGR